MRNGITEEFFETAKENPQDPKVEQLRKKISAEAANSRSDAIAARLADLAKSINTLAWTGSDITYSLRLALLAGRIRGLADGIWDRQSQYQKKIRQRHSAEIS